MAGTPAAGRGWGCVTFGLRNLPFVQKRFGDKRERERRARVLEIDVNPSMFMQGLARRREEGS